MNNLSLAQAARRIAELTGTPRASTPTINRYCSQGIRAPNGERVYLKSVRRGRMRFTSEEAVRDFVEATNPPRHEDAEAELIADGC